MRTHHLQKTVINSKFIIYIITTLFWYSNLYMQMYRKGTF